MHLQFYCGDGEIRSRLPKRRQPHIVQQSGFNNVRSELKGPVVGIPGSAWWGKHKQQPDAAWL